MLQVAMYNKKIKVKPLSKDKLEFIMILNKVEIQMIGEGAILPGRYSLAMGLRPFRA